VWIGTRMGLTEGDFFSVDVDVDMGAPTSMRGAQVKAYGQLASEMSEDLEVFTSDDGIAWTSRGTAATDTGGVLVGVTFPEMTARYVRFRISRVYGGPPESAADCLTIGEVEVLQGALEGSFESEPIILTDTGMSTGSKVVWSSALTGDSQVGVQTMLSLDGGTTWGEWLDATNGQPLADLPENQSLSDVAFRWRTFIVRSSQSSTPRLRPLSVIFGTTREWSPVTWPGSTVPIGSCANCHVPHAQSNGKLTQVGGNALCIGCHNAPTAARPPSYSFSDDVAYSGSAHQGQACVDCHPAHGSASDGAGSASIVSGRDGSLCFKCHPGVASAFTVSVDPLTHHDAGSGARGTGGTKLHCDDCHNPHSVTTAAKVTDPDAPGTLLSLTVPATSVETQTLEMDIPITADATLDSENPTCTYGASDHVVVDATRNAILRADVDALGPGAYITSAELRVYAPYEERADSITPHVLSPGDWNAWNEGTGTGEVNDGTVNGATWFERWYGENEGGAYTSWSNLADWNTPGGAGDDTWEGDGAGNAPYGPFSTSSFAAILPDDPWATLDVSVMVRAAYARNYENWSDILLKSSTVDGRLSFESVQAVDPARRPYIHVHFYRTTMLIPASEDTYVSSTSPDMNAGQTPYLCVSNDGTEVREALLKFDMSAIPANATITGARLRLYGSAVDYPWRGEFGVRALTDAWNEGSGDEDTNNATIDGATYNERVFGQAWTTVPDSGDEIVPWNQDDSHQPYGYEQWITIEAPGLVEALQRPDVTGIALVEYDVATWLNVHSSETDRPPYLEVQYSLAEPVPGANSIEFCVKCHDGEQAPGDIGTAAQIMGGASVREQYRFTNSHGFANALGTGSRPTFDATATLKPPYFYGMGPLQCTECHDPHGSRNVYHLKETINGKSGLRVTTREGSDWENVQNWCTACHTIEPHPWWGNNCIGCHYHGRTTGRRF
jgi:predicted CXXCH cytochrome family protein